MIREKVTVKDYFRIAKQNEYFVWHFVQKEQHKSTLGLSSIIDNKKDTNPLNFLFEGLDIPYYESYTEDSLDFLMGLGLRYENLYTPYLPGKLMLPNNFKFNPILILFKKYTKIISTHEICYCLEGVVEIISKSEPKYLEQILNNIEKNPK